MADAADDSTDAGSDIDDVNDNFQESDAPPYQDNAPDHHESDEPEHVAIEHVGQQLQLDSNIAISMLQDAQQRLARMLETSSEIMTLAGNVNAESLYDPACQDLVREFSTNLSEVRETLRTCIASCPRPLRFSRRADADQHRLLLNWHRLQLARQLARQLPHRQHDVPLD